MRHLATLFLLLTLLQPTPPPLPLRATWERSGVARVVHGPGCLFRNDTLYRCYQESGVLRLGAHGPLDAAYRPAAGDVYTLVGADGSVERAPLRGVVYLPVIR